MAYIDDFEIHNFRGIEKLSIQNCSPINVLIGKNNIGKTSVLESVFLLAGMSNPQLPLNVNLFRGIVPQNVNNLSFLFYGLEVSNAVSFTAHFTNGYQRELKISPKRQTLSDLASKPISTSMSNSALVGLSLDFSEKYAGQERNAYQSSMVYEVSAIRNEVAPNYFEEISAVFIHSESSRNDYSEPISKIVKEQRDFKLLELIQQFDPNVESFKLLPDGLYLSYKGLDKMILANAAGDGLKKFITIAAAMLAQQNAIILIDEIENGIHYSAYPTLWKALFKAAQKNSNQLFITTHSLEELKYLQQAIDDEPTFQEMLSVFTINRSSKRGLEALHYGYESFSDALENENEMRN